MACSAQSNEIQDRDIVLTPEEAAKRQEWEREQELLKSQLSQEDSNEVLSWQKGDDRFDGLHHIAGVDISFSKDSPDSACAMLAILSYPELEVVHISSTKVTMTEPYIPGFLAFREVNFLLERLDAVKIDHPHLVPQVILVDGNGVLHPRGFGLASHLGVLCGIPSVGIGKNLYYVDGLEKGPLHKEKITNLNKKGDYFDLKGDSGRIWGVALRTSDDAPNPVYVSVGHKISLETARLLVIACSIKRIPEPVRQADIQSREWLRTHES